MFIQEVIPSFVKNSRGKRSVEITVKTYEGVFRASAPRCRRRDTPGRVTVGQES